MNISFFVHAQTFSQDGKIQEASHRIISLMKSTTFSYQLGIQEQLKQRETKLAGNEGKLSILRKIQYYIGGFLACGEHNGEWIDSYFECEYLDQQVCENIGGIYSACASACRHSNTNICILACREVCEL